MVECGNSSESNGSLIVHEKVWLCCLFAVSFADLSRGALPPYSLFTAGVHIRAAILLLYLYLSTLFM